MDCGSGLTKSEDNEVVTLKATHSNSSTWKMYLPTNLTGDFEASVEAKLNQEHTNSYAVYIGHMNGTALSNMQINY